MAKGEKAPCPTCGHAFAVSTDGALRRHPRGAPEPCPGSGYVVRAPDGEARPAVVGRRPAPTRPPGGPLPPGVYRSRERMLEQGDRCPPGHATVSIIALIPYDGSNGRTPEEEATRLFEDPDYLSKVLDAVPNRRFRLLLKIDPVR